MAEPLKNIFNQTFFDQFVLIVKSTYRSFNDQRFLSLIYDEEWEKRELKQRISHISQALHATLPQSYPSALRILLDISPRCKGFEYLFFPDFVEKYGLEHWNASMLALETFTVYSSSEFAVRAFLLKDQEKMMRQMQRWSMHENHHVRRLATEGCRPRLPWAITLPFLKKDPSPILPILQRLKRDPSEYVRKSVANNINDIAKDHPELVKQLIREWRGDNPLTDWILKHGSRTLLKKGDAETLCLYGYTPTANVHVQNLTLSTNQLTIGEELTFSFNLNNKSEQLQKVRIEYGIYFVKANGRQNRKVFYLSEKTCSKGMIQFVRKHTFNHLSTRTLYPGMHKLTVIINGEEKAEIDFMLHASNQSGSSF